MCTGSALQSRRFGGRGRTGMGSFQQNCEFITENTLFIIAFYSEMHILGSYMQLITFHEFYIYFILLKCPPMPSIDTPTA